MMSSIRWSVGAAVAVSHLRMQPQSFALACRTVRQHRLARYASMRLTNPPASQAFFRSSVVIGNRPNSRSQSDAAVAFAVFVIAVDDGDDVKNRCIFYRAVLKVRLAGPRGACIDYMTSEPLHCSRSSTTACSWKCRAKRRYATFGCHITAWRTLPRSWRMIRILKRQCR